MLGGASAVASAGGAIPIRSELVTGASQIAARLPRSTARRPTGRDETAAELGGDGAAWRSLFGALAERFDDIAADFLRPMPHVPSHPLKLARFGACSAPPAALLGRRFRMPEGRALLAGVAAHAFRRSARRCPRRSA